MATRVAAPSIIVLLLSLSACDDDDGGPAPWGGDDGGVADDGDDAGGTGDDDDGDDDGDDGDGDGDGDDGGADDDGVDDGDAGDGGGDDAADDAADGDDASDESDGGGDEAGSDGAGDDAGAACTDAQEPNDDLGSATDATPQTPYVGTTCTGDIDLFAFTNPTPSAWAMLEAEFDPSAGDIDLFLYEADGTTIVGQSTAASPVEHIEAWQIPVGDYVVAVEHAGGETVDYTLTVQFHE